MHHRFGKVRAGGDVDRNEELAFDHQPRGEH